MRLLGIMELQLASSFLPLLLLAWLPTGTVSKTAGTVSKTAGAVSKTAESVNKTAESVNTRRCKFEIWSENLTVIVENKSKDQEVWSQTNITALGENCTNIISPCMHAANCELTVFISRINSDNASDKKETPPRCCPAGPQTSVTEERIWTGLNLLCIFFGLSVGTLICMPVIGFLLWQRGRNRTGKLRSREVAEGNQLTMATPVTETEDLTYANLSFEKKETKPTSSNTIYTEIKPSQQQQSGEDANAATTEMEVCPKGEGK